MRTKVADKPAAKPETLDVMPIIEHYVRLRKMEKRLQKKIEVAYDKFAAAATAIEADGMEVAKAKIQLSRTPFQWSYSPKIVKAEKVLKELKANFQETHDPSGGGEPVWKVVTNL
jgi:hypothetical protein